MSNPNYLGGSKELELTWHDQRSCWKKKYKGKQYYAPLKAKGKTDRTAYEASVKWWADKKAELDGIRRQEAAQANPFEFIETASSEVVNALALAVQRKADYEVETLGMANPPTLEQWETSKRAIAEADNQKAIDQTFSVEAFKNRFLAVKKAQAATAQRSAGRYANRRSALGNFTKALGEKKDARKVEWGSR